MKSIHQFSCLCALAVLALALFQCKSRQMSNMATTTQKNIEAREDSLALVAAYQAQGLINSSIEPAIETKVMPSKVEEDAADDPAIYINATDPTSSLIFGTDKTGGVAVYDLSGEQLAYHAVGKTNNVDVLYHIKLAGRTIDIVGWSNRTSQSLDIYEILHQGKIKLLTSHSLKDTKIDDAYGFCFGHDVKTGKNYALINGKNGHVVQYEIKSTIDQLTLEIRRELQMINQTEGMVVDKKSGTVFIGVEEAGIFYTPINPNQRAKPRFIATSSSKNNAAIVYDVEGLTLFDVEDKTYLIASSQGNFSFAVFQGFPPYDYVCSFKIKGNDQLDGVEETDGLDATNISLGERFPKGMLVVQDGFNFKGDDAQPQNFKYVDAQFVEELIRENLLKN